MHRKFYPSAFWSALLFAATTVPALAQSVPGTGSVPPPDTTTTNAGSVGISSAPGGASTTATGAGAGTEAKPGAHLYSGNSGQTGAENSSATVGTGSARHDLPADDPLHTGVPGRPER